MPNNPPARVVKNNGRDAIQTIAGGFVNRTKDATLSAFGSNRANGRLQVNLTVKQLMAQYQTWLGQKGQKASYENFVTWIHAKYGDQYDDVFEPVANRLGLLYQPQQQPVQNTGPNVRPQNVSSNPVNPPGPTIAPATEGRRMFALTKRILSEARQSGRVNEYIDYIRENPDSIKCSENIKSATIEKSADLASYLVENNIRDRFEVAKAFAKFLLEDNLQRSVITQLLTPVAQEMVTAGDVEFQAPHWLGGKTQQTQPNRPGTNPQNIQTPQNNQQKTNTNNKHLDSSDPDLSKLFNIDLIGNEASPIQTRIANSKIDVNILSHGLKDARIDPSLSKTILEIAGNSPNFKSFIAKLGARHLKFPLEAFTAMFQSVKV